MVGRCVAQRVSPHARRFLLLCGVVLPLLEEFAPPVLGECPLFVQQERTASVQQALSPALLFLWVLVLLRGFCGKSVLLLLEERSASVQQALSPALLLLWVLVLLSRCCGKEF